MIPEKVFHQILALGDAWRVSRVDYVAAGRVRWGSYSFDLLDYVDSEPLVNEPTQYE